MPIRKALGVEREFGTQSPWVKVVLAPFPGVLPALTLGTARLAVNVSYVPGRFVTEATDLRYKDSGIKSILFLQLKLALPDRFAAFGPRR